MTLYEQGFSAGQEFINDFGLRNAQEHAERLRDNGMRLNMASIGFRTAVTLHMERMMTP